ncbi:MAG: YciI family protein [Devosia sp.]
MRFIHLVHFDPTILEAMPLEQRQDIDRRALAKNTELQASGHLLHSEALQNAMGGVLVRVRNGEISVTDGPYLETKEQLCGFVLIEAANQAEAVALAQDDPLADIGTIEVRKIFEFPA